MFFLGWLTVSEPSSVGRQRDRNGLSSFVQTLQSLDSLNGLTHLNGVKFPVSVQRGKNGHGKLADSFSHERVLD